MTFAVSPRHTVEKLASGALEDMIEVYEDQVRGWLVEPANHLRYQQHAGFAILAIVLPYFESVGQFVEGKRRGSEEQFVVGLKEVFPNLDPSIPQLVFSELYDQLRCGMFHRGITKGKVVIMPTGPNPIEVEYGPNGVVGRITVVPVNLIGEVHHHLQRYLSELRDPANVQLRQNFEAWFRARAS